jgi:hypothetical protein
MESLKKNINKNDISMRENTRFKYVFVQTQIWDDNSEIEINVPRVLAGLECSYTSS